MPSRRLQIFICFLLCLFIISACQVPVLLGRPAATPAPGLVNTLAAQTMAVLFSATPLHSATPAPSATPRPTDTLAPSRTPLPSKTPFSTPTSPFSPTPIITGTNALAGLPCNAAQFVKDVSYPDGALAVPGAPFIKTWRIKNAGACTWSTQVHIVFVDGERMNPIPIKLTKEVKPKEMVDISVILTAPEKTGDYFSTWLLTDGVSNFGLGPEGDQAFWLAILVRPVGSGKIFDFVATACGAVWKNEAGELPCPGNGLESTGFVLPQEAPAAIRGTTSGIFQLITVPPLQAGGIITGTYPAIRIEKDYHFFTLLGCLPNHPGCNVTFRLEYSVSGGPPELLGQWKVTADDSKHVDINLVIISGETVQFILSVKANGPYVSDNQAVWQDPQIQR